MFYLTLKNSAITLKLYSELNLMSSAITLILYFNGEKIVKSTLL